MADVNITGLYGGFQHINVSNGQQRFIRRLLELPSNFTAAMRTCHCNGCDNLTDWNAAGGRLGMKYHPKMYKYTPSTPSTPVVRVDPHQINYAH